MIYALWKKKKDKLKIKNTVWQMHCDDIINAMWKRKFEKCNVENEIRQMQCKTRPSSDSEAATMYKLKGHVVN